LAKRQVPFRAAVHSIEKSGKVKDLGTNIHIAPVDAFNPESLSCALDGIEKVFMLTPPDGRTVKAGNALIDAILKYGKVKHIVKLSALGAEETGGKFLWAEDHRVIEDRINEVGIPQTILRPSCFHSNIWMDAHSIKTQSKVYKAIGTAKMNWISNEDIGEVAVVALIDETDAHHGKIYNLTGPDNLTGAESTKILSSAFGKEIAFVSLTNDQLRQHAASFLPPHSIDGFCNMMTYFENGGYDRSYDDVAKIIGRKGKSLTEYAATIAATNLEAFV